MRITKSTTFAIQDKDKRIKTMVEKQVVKGIVQHSLSCGDLDDKIDTTHACTLSMRLKLYSVSCIPISIANRNSHCTHKFFVTYIKSFSNLT